MRYLWILAVLQIADVLTTGYSWKDPARLEANPVTRELMYAFGPLWWLPKAVLIAAIAVMILRGPRVPTRALNIVCGLYGAIVMWNIVNITLG